jgi:hypothetical protein
MPMDHAAHHARMTAPPFGAVPTMPGQDAFGAIQEIVGILDAAPNTDWSKVNIEALRQHLIDMNEVTLNAKAVATPVDGGTRYEVSGEGRTLEAIKRMVPAHTHEIDVSVICSARCVEDRHARDYWDGFLSSGLDQAA